MHSRWCSLPRKRMKTLQGGGWGTTGWKGDLGKRTRESRRDNKEPLQHPRMWQEGPGEQIPRDGWDPSPPAQQWWGHTWGSELPSVRGWIREWGTGWAGEAETPGAVQPETEKAPGISQTNRNSWRNRGKKMQPDTSQRWPGKLEEARGTDWLMLHPI